MKLSITIGFICLIKCMLSKYAFAKRASLPTQNVIIVQACTNTHKHKYYFVHVLKNYVSLSHTKFTVGTNDIVPVWIHSKAV